MYRMKQTLKNGYPRNDGTTAIEVKEIIDSHKSDRAPGVDGVLAKMLKQASVDFVQVLTDQINRH